MLCCFWKWISIVIHSQNPRITVWRPPFVCAICYYFTQISVIYDAVLRQCCVTFQCKTYVSVTASYLKVKRRKRLIIILKKVFLRLSWPYFTFNLQWLIRMSTKATPPLCASYYCLRIFYSIADMDLVTVLG